jgi:hypothetical protein
MAAGEDFYVAVDSTLDLRGVHLLSADVDEIAVAAQDAQAGAFDLNEILRVEPSFGLEWAGRINTRPSRSPT